MADKNNIFLIFFAIILNLRYYGKLNLTKIEDAPCRMDSPAILRAKLTTAQFTGHNSPRTIHRGTI
jgi:hypothetical protein